MQINILSEIQDKWNLLSKPGVPFLIALDGRCAAGKTTLAAQLQEKTGCNVLHMDDFFLRPEQRTKERLQQPGGNVDWERFRDEVLFPLKRGISCFYRPYDCHTQMFKKSVQIYPNGLTLVEGSYSCHPELWNFYHFHIFLTVSPEKQLCRIRKRNGTEELEMFQKKWIPLEELYFQTFSIKERCELCYDMEGR